MEMKPSILWPLVALIGIVMGGAIALKRMGEGIEVIIILVTILVVPALGAFGVKIHENVQEMKTMVNGSQSRLVDTIQQGQVVQGDNMRQLQENFNALQLAVQTNVSQLQSAVQTLALQVPPPTAPLALTAAPEAEEGNHL
jgi:predicted PurR-regulated permease PerM